jgi:hypothetical protein
LLGSLLICPGLGIAKRRGAGSGRVTQALAGSYRASVTTDRDLITALFPAAAALSGLLLVFLGIVLSAFQSYSAATPAAAVAPYRRAGGAILAAFLFGLGTVAVALAWLLSPSRGLRDAAVLLFCVQLAMLSVSAVGSARLVLWR